MKQASYRLANSTGRPGAGEQARIRIIILVLVFFLLGLAGGAFWLFHSAESGGTGNTAGEADCKLSDRTKTVLKGLDSLVEIRFYSLLDPASVPASLNAFAARVDLLLSAYQREANGKIHVVRYNTRSDSNANAALADGIRAFNRDRGDVCYLGLMVAHNQQKESFPQLSAEWEQALEFDLSRAIERVASLQTPTQPAVAIASQTDTAAPEAVGRAIPNFTNLSIEEGTQLLREAALKDFKTAADEMETKVREARQQLSAAQNSGSATEQEAAMKQLQQLQAEQAEKLRQIAARSQSQIEAFKQLKGTAR